jgi:hypothetical protein
MDIREFSRAYARSPLGIASLFVALGAGASARLLGLYLPAAALIGLASLAAFFAAGLAFGFGQRAAVAEVDREALATAESRLAAAAAARQRLAALRLADPGVAGARDLVVLEAGRLVEDCRRASTYDPEGVEAVIDSLALIDGWLKETDERSVEKRFDLADAHPFPEAAARTAEALRAKASVISAGRAAATGEVSGADRLAIEEELK